MRDYRQQVVAALGAVAIRSATTYAWLGRASRRLPAPVEDDLDDVQSRRYLAACLREELYASFYCHGRPIPASWGAPEPVSGDPWLLAAIARANTGRGSWEPGWTVRRVDRDGAVVENGRLRVRAVQADCAGDLRPGATVALRRPKELPGLSPGFCTVIGDAGDEADTLVRVYWNITRTGAPALVRGLTVPLNANRIPFRLKVADHPRRLERRDAAVLYVDGDAFGGLRAVLCEVAAELTAQLRPGIPAFTLELAPGVGLAEDASGESFGTSRCALLADGIVRGHEQGITRTADRVDAVVTRFAESGVPIDAPYRDPSLACHVL